MACLHHDFNCPFLTLKCQFMNLFASIFSFPHSLSFYVVIETIIYGIRCCWCYRLGRTSEFLIYGHGQQRRAIIEALRLLENEKSRQSHNACILGEDSSGITSPQYFKDKSKTWLKFVTKVVQSMLFIRRCVFSI